jgi:hypothetical protein
MRVSNGVALGLCVVLGTGCGQVREDEFDGSVDSTPGTRWLALLGDHVELVRFDDDSAKTTQVLAANAPDATLSFSNDGTRLVYAQRLTPQTWTAQVVTVPDGQAIGNPWTFSEISPPTLVWIGTDTVLAQANPQEASALMTLGRPEVQPLDNLLLVKASKNGDSAIARKKDNGLLYVSGDGAFRTLNVPSPLETVAHLADDGLALALFSRRELPSFDLPIAAKRVQWSPPEPTPCTSGPSQTCEKERAYTVGEFEWPSADSEIVVEYQALGSPLRMALASIQASDVDTVTATAPPALNPVLARVWGIDAEGRAFMTANPELTGDPWWLVVGTEPAPLSRHRGPVGFAQAALLSGDQQTLFVVSFFNLKKTLHALEYPPTEPLVSVALFSSDEYIGPILPQPGGPGVVIGTGPTWVTECAAPLTDGCNSIAYSVSDGKSAARPLPAEFQNPRWTPDGAGIIGNLSDGRVVYINPAKPEQLTPLGRGRFVLPARW